MGFSLQIMRSVAAAFICTLFWFGAAFAFCAAQIVQLQDAGAKVQFSTEIAISSEEQAQGLMHRAYMPPFSAMLFVNKVEAPRSFWMKNTLIPLDILFFDKNGHLVNVAKNARPHDLTSLRSSAPAKYVLEINGGLFDRLRLTGSVQLDITKQLFLDDFAVCRTAQ